MWKYTTEKQEDNVRIPLIMFYSFWKLALGTFTVWIVGICSPLQNTIEFTTVTQNWSVQNALATSLSSNTSILLTPLYPQQTRLCRPLQIARLPLQASPIPLRAIKPVNSALSSSSHRRSSPIPQMPLCLLSVGTCLYPRSMFSHQYSESAVVPSYS